jgi:hypothetical protein
MVPKASPTIWKLRLAVILIAILFLSISTGSPFATADSTSRTSTVSTPFGKAPRNCVYGVPSGTQVLANDVLIYPNGERVILPPCSSPTPPVTNGWVEDANWCYCPTSPPSIDEFVAYWKVPSAPTANGGQVVYLFNGLQPSSTTGPIIQPVLQWGNNGYYGGNYWEIVSWFYSSANNYVYSTPVQVSAGDQLEGYMAGAGCNSNGACNWNVATLDQTSSTSTWLYCSINSKVCGLAMYWAMMTLEVYSVSVCSDYPSSSPTTFTGMYLQNQNLAQITPSWAGSVLINDGCGESVTVSSSTSVSLSY